MGPMKPILFNTEMVRAILDGRKTVTRRIAKVSTEITCIADGTTNHEFLPDNFTGGAPTGYVCRKCGFGVAPPYCRVPCGESLFRPRYWPSDILYVRETWSFWPCFDCDNEMCYGRGISYKETDGCFVYKTQKSKVPYEEKWRPSIHMPKVAARIFLRVTDVSVERLQNIDAAGIRAEGVGTMAAFAGDMEIASAEFRNLWNSTIKPADFAAFGWDANPWVWVYKFQQISKEEAQA